MNRRNLLISSFAALVLGATAAEAAPEIYTGIIKGVGAGGYDVVNFHTAKSAKPGDKKFSATYKGAKWYFLSEANKKAFEASPGKYAPAYGGYCAYALSNNILAKGDPRQWSIVGGKLYLNLNGRAKSLWLEDTAGNIAKGNGYWPQVLKK